MMDSVTGKMDRQTGQPSLDIVRRLIRSDKVVWEGSKVPATPATGGAARSVLAGGVLTLGINSAPEEYILEIARDLRISAP